MNIWPSTTESRALLAGLFCLLLPGWGLLAQGGEHGLPAPERVDHAERGLPAHAGEGGILPRRFPRQRQEDMRRQKRRARQKARHKREEAFLKTLSETDRQTLLAIKSPRARSRAILRLRIQRNLARVLREARMMGLVTEDEVKLLRAQKNLRKQAEKTFELQKRIFIKTYREALMTLPPARRAALLGLPPRKFFEHPAIKHLPLFHFFPPARVRRLLRRDPRLRRRFLAAVRAGQRPQDLKLLLRPGTWSEFLKLRLDAQKKILHLLQKAPFLRWRQARPRGPGPRRPDRRPRRRHPGPGGKPPQGRTPPSI